MNPSSDVAAGVRPNAGPARGRARLLRRAVPLGAAVALALVSGPPARAADEPLTAALAARDPRPTETLLGSLRADESESARRALVRIAFESPSVRLRRAAAEALSARKDRDATIDGLVAKWQAAGPVATTAERAIDALGALPSAKSEKALAVRRKQGDPALADAVTTAWLGIVSLPAHFEEVRKISRGDESPRRRAQAVAALGRLATDPEQAPRALEALVAAAAAERSPAVREAVLRALEAWPKETLDPALADRLGKADPEGRANLLLLGAMRPFPGMDDVARKALKATSAAVVAAALLALGATPTPDATDDPELVAKAGVSDPVVRDAAVEAILRRATDPAVRRALLDTKTLPLSLRTGLLATFAGPADPAGLALLVEAAKGTDPAVVATAIGAIRRGHGAAGKDALAALASGGSARAKAILEAIGAAASETTKRRAFVVRGNGDRAEDVLGEVGFQVVAYSSGSGLAGLRASPEDVVVVDGPGELDGKAEAALVAFVHAGGTLVLGNGLSNQVLRALLPDAFDAAPKNLRLDTGLTALTGVLDRVVVPARRTDPTVAAGLGPTPAVLVVTAPVIPRTAAAKPLLWSFDLEEAQGGAPCFAAEVRLGMGRVLATGAVLGLKGAEAADGWFARIRVDRTHPQRLPNAPDLRFWVAYDWMGFGGDRLEILRTKGYFDGGDALAGTADLPAIRFLLAFLERR